MANQRNTLGILIVIPIVSVLLFSCIDPFHRGAQGGGGSVPDSVLYDGDVYPILLSRCSSCHEEGGTASSSSFVLTNDSTTDFAMVTSLVSAENSEVSALLQKASGQTAHSGGNVLTTSSVEYQTIASWIDAGASSE